LGYLSPIRYANKWEEKQKNITLENSN